MLPIYPEFSPLNLSLKPVLDVITNKYPPYSDFNFVSLFSWNYKDAIHISTLNENLIIRLPDYITNQPVLSIIGSNETDRSLHRLLEANQSLYLVPKIVVDSLLHPEMFKIVEDKDSFDYVYDLERISKLNGHEYKWKRKRLRQFHRTHGESLDINQFDSLPQDLHLVIMGLFDEWSLQKQVENSESFRERHAINTMLTHFNELNLLGTLLSIRGKPVGFSINEVLDQEFAVCHFQKSLFDYPHLDIALTNAAQTHLAKRGCKYVNWEQDLGIDGLRQFKESYLPIYYLEKFTLSVA